MRDRRRVETVLSCNGGKIGGVSELDDNLIGNIIALCKRKARSDDGEKGREYEPKSDLIQVTAHYVRADKASPLL